MFGLHVAGKWKEEVPWERPPEEDIPSAPSVGAQDEVIGEGVEPSKDWKDWGWSSAWHWDGWDRSWDGYWRSPWRWDSWPRSWDGWSGSWDGWGGGWGDWGWGGWGQGWSGGWGKSWNDWRDGWWNWDNWKSSPSNESGVGWWQQAENKDGQEDRSNWWSKASRDWWDRDWQSPSQPEDPEAAHEERRWEAPASSLAFISSATVGLQKTFMT
eukprot:Skav226246  [mRNA]  locus=scaffold1218:628556:629191:- [translate_table: standard]